jgi:hypothetical protein
MILASSFSVVINPAFLRPGGWLGAHTANLRVLACSVGSSLLAAGRQWGPGSLESSSCALTHPTESFQFHSV